MVALDSLLILLKDNSKGLEWVNSRRLAERMHTYFCQYVMARNMGMQFSASFRS